LQSNENVSDDMAVRGCSLCNVRDGVEYLSCLFDIACLPVDESMLYRSMASDVVPIIAIQLTSCQFF
jgi:hypothetical protein